MPHTPLPSLGAPTEDPDLAADLADWIDVAPHGTGAFLGTCHDGAPGRVMGGQIAAQALTAAGRTVDPQWAPHSLHGYFLRGGDPRIPVEYRVENLRDGRSYAARRVTAEQHGHPVFTLTASFKTAEQAPGRQRRMPTVPAPEDLPDAFLAGRESEPDLYEASVYTRVAALRVAPVAADSRDRADGETSRAVWMRAYAVLPPDPLTHAAALTYLADLTLAQTSIADRQRELFPFHPKPPRFQVASLDHALWFHRPFRADEWLLFVQRSPSVGDGRGLSTGDFYTRDGRLVASAAQESLVRDLT